MLSQFKSQGEILWLQPQGFTGALRKLAHAQMRQAGVSPNLCKEFTLPNKWKVYTGKKTWHCHDEAINWLANLVAEENPQIILVNSDIALAVLTDNRYKSLAVMRGSVLYCADTPCLVIDKIQKFHTVKWGPWIIRKDFEKLKRWIENDRRSEFPFTYEVCESIDTIKQLRDRIARALLVSIDIETTGTGSRAQISSISYTVWWLHAGRLHYHTWVIPLVYTCNESSRFWNPPEDETVVWSIIKELHDSPAIKVMQNGSYDSCYFIKYRCPLRNYFLDPAHAFHSIWPEAPKRLDFAASVACDHYKFWKDEGKEDEKDDDKSSKLPSTPEGYKAYWRYNALDTHFTALTGWWVLRVLLLPKNRWALFNYIKEMRQVLGPALAMSMRGAKVNQELQFHYFQTNKEIAAIELGKLQLMVGIPDFNPRSWQQKQKVIYDIARAKPLPRKGKSTDEKILKIIQTQSPILDLVIRQMFRYLKPSNNASKYGDKLQLLNGRWMYKMNGGGTETGRYASKAHDFWIGTQIQNPPYAIRSMVEADNDYFILKIDYAKSDMWFTAFESQDANMLATVTGEEDSHCIHTAKFFQLPFDEVEREWKADNPWITHNATGLRSVSKRIGYGANYLMAGYTLFLTMGIEAVAAAAKQLGYKDVDNWQIKQYIDFCQHMINIYFSELYPETLPWIKNESVQTRARGNKATCYGGRTRTFFRNPVDDAPTQRELAAFYGQGGTAGNINQALENLYWRGDLDASGRFILLFQVHDEIDGLIRRDDLSGVPEVINQMENTCKIKGHEFVVPTEAEIGCGWGKRLMKWHPGITREEIEEYDRQWWAKTFPGKSHSWNQKEARGTA